MTLCPDPYCIGMCAFLLMYRAICIHNMCIYIYISLSLSLYVYVYVYVYVCIDMFLYMYMCVYVYSIDASPLYVSIDVSGPSTVGYLLYYHILYAILYYICLCICV